eukprot:11972277-Prorocentrum_lima.AAC.1
MKEESKPYALKKGEAGPFIKERDEFEEDQQLKVLHGTSMPMFEDQVAQVDTKLVSDMEEHLRN